MVFIVEMFASWLFDQVAGQSRKRLTTWVMGSDQERALMRAAAAAVQLTAQELCPDGGEQARQMAMVIDHVFGEPVPGASMTGHATLLQAIKAGIAAQLAPLDDADLTGTQSSSAGLLGVSADTVAAALTRHLLREVMVRAAGGGPLGPLASQLNHDLSHLQVQEMTGMLAGLSDGVLQAVARLEGQIAGLADVPGVVAHTLPADVTSFTGREAELDALFEELSRSSGGGMVSISAIDGMAGVGKTAFAVHAAHRLASRFPDGQLFLRLHAHSLGQMPVDPADALAALLLGDGVVSQQIPAGQEAREALWRNRIAGRKVLLLLDDAASSEQVRPLVPGTGGILVLVTSRHRLTALPEALSVTLDILEEADATRLFVRLSRRPELLATDDAVAKIVSLCGHLPLAISLMAGQLKHHRAWTVVDLAAALESAVNRLTLMVAENISVAAAFDLSYNNLTPDRQQIFRRLGLHPGTDIDVYAAGALNDTAGDITHSLLESLFSYHLIDEPMRGRYRFHDLLREHARTLAAADPAHERSAATDRLLDYYLYTARAADHYLAVRTPAGVPAVAGIPPASAPDLRVRSEAVAWMDSERLNLQAAVSLAEQQDRSGHAVAIPAAMNGFLRVQGYWDQGIALYSTALNAARRTSDRPAEASTLNDLGTIQRIAGKYPSATASLSRALELYADLGLQHGQANTLHQLGVVQSMTGDNSASATSQERALELFGHLGDRLGEANALNDLAAVQALTGDYPAALTSLTRAMGLYAELGDTLGEASALNYLGTVQRLTGDYPASAASQERALELQRQLGNRNGEAAALCELGAAQRLIGDYPASVASQQRALVLFRNVGNLLGEASALNDLGVVQTLTGDYAASAATLTQALALYRLVGHQRGEASALCDLGAALQAAGDFVAATANLSEALEMYRGLGNRNGEAEVLNNIGELALASGSCADAHSRHDEALTIALEIPSLAEEARALEGIGRCHLQSREVDQGIITLGRAARIYQRIKSPYAQRVEKTLRDIGL